MRSDRSTDDLAGVREALAARLGDCWDRLDDAVSELAIVHRVPDAQILERVRMVIAAER
jgi:hypothetical protein